MKKYLVLLLLLFVVTGCDKSYINKEDYNSIFDTFLSNSTSLVNKYSTGYKYYLPSGIRVIKSGDYNEELYYNGYRYYMYLDIVSYYYKNDIEYTIDNSLFYSKELDYNGIKGYVKIVKDDDLYKIEMYYNYAKIETYVDKDNLGQTLINMCYILNSIKYNDSIIELYVGSEETKLNEEVYDFYTPRKEGNFINYINQFDDYEDYEEVNENNIGNEGNE